MKGCNCLDPTVYGHITPCPLGGWFGQVYNQSEADCNREGGQP